VKNPGIHYARKAAAEVGGSVVYPEFKAVDRQPTDFNDLHKEEGADAVRNAIATHLVEPPKSAKQPTPNQGLPCGIPLAGTTSPFEGLPFDSYGFDHDGYYFKRLDGGIVKRYTASQLAT